MRGRGGEGGEEGRRGGGEEGRRGGGEEGRRGGGVGGGGRGEGEERGEVGRKRINCHTGT